MEKHFPNGDESQVSVDVYALQEFSRLLQSQSKKQNSESCRRRRLIQKVPPQIRQRVQESDKRYDPVMVSIGPYHHGKPELQRGEELKHLCLDRRAGGDDKKKAFFYSKILDDIEMIRDSYADVEIVEKYDDKSLALMMLLDASMLIDFMHNYMEMKGSSFSDWERCLGANSGPFMIRDGMVMENQIPYRVVKLLLSLLYGSGEAELFVSRFLSKRTGIMELKDIGIPGENEDPPIHLLEAIWRLLVRKRLGPNGGNRFSMREAMHNGSVSDSDGDSSYTPPRSVMDLKAKGIRVRLSSTSSVRDITFRPKACFSQLHLPLQFVSSVSPVVWSNMIAFEVSPDSMNSPIMLSYAHFLKSLIQTPEDVKELQENGVILNQLANLEKVVEVYKGIDTFGLHDQDVFKKVKIEIEEHCKSRAKTWVAELIYTRFRTPWTVIALFAAVILLSLTFLQTFFTINR